MHNELVIFFDKMATSWDRRELKNQLWLSTFINKYLPIKKGMNTLDLGCGTGIISEIVYQITETKVSAMDISSKMIKIAKNKHNPEHIEFFNENFYSTKKSNFDVIVCFNAYPHFTDIKAFKNKSIEVLNDNGYLIVIHSLSRKKLSECHEGLSSNISRELKPINDEIDIYLNEFNVVEKIDNTEMFLMILQKK